MSTHAARIGRRAENLALWYLRLRGLRYVARNYATRLGEIDLVMIDRCRDVLAFIEVRYRTGTTHGGPAASVTRQKQQRIIATARHFVQNQKKFGDRSIRFDVVSISKPNYLPQIEWIRDAFQS